MPSGITRRSGGSIAPVWQRPLACGVVVLAHAAIILAVTWPDFDVNVPVHLQINVVAQGEPARSLSAVDSQPMQEVKPVSQQLHETNAEFKRESADTTEIQTKEPMETHTREPDLPEASAARPPERERLAPPVVSEQAQSRDLAQLPSPDAVQAPVSSDVASAPAPLTEAKEAQEQADKHKKMAQDYGMASIGRQATKTHFHQHCEALVRSYESAAKEYNDLAKMHEEMAKAAK